jgi:predicted RNA-binding Zn-ribbon protein involved in translation (DUF1610 family)
MRWECTECGAELKQTSKPGTCPECGTAALFVCVAGATVGADLEPDDPRQSWIALGLHWAAEGSFAES